VCDWIGSNTDIFLYQELDAELADYFAASMEKIQVNDALHRFGLLAKANGYGGVSALLNSKESPRGIPFRFW